MFSNITDAGGGGQEADEFLFPRPNLFGSGTHGTVWRVTFFVDIKKNKKSEYATYNFPSFKMIYQYLNAQFKI